MAELRLNEYHPSGRMSLDREDPSDANVGDRQTAHFFLFLELALYRRRALSIHVL